MTSLAKVVSILYPAPDTVYLAEEMVRRFAPIEQVRFCNSGTEATMDAIRLARAHAGRDKIVKIEGSYHGHHDTVMMSTKPSIEAAGPADRPHTVPASKGIPTDVKENTIIAPYNDPEALDRILSEHKGEVAAVITEAVLMNVGIMLPDEGYLQSCAGHHTQAWGIAHLRRGKNGCNCCTRRCHGNLSGGTGLDLPGEVNWWWYADRRISVGGKRSCVALTTVKYCTLALLMAILCRCVRDWLH